MKQDSNEFPITELKSFGFKAFIFSISLVSIFPIISAIMGVNGMFLEGSPKWFFIVSIGISLLTLLSIYFIYQFKKIAVYALISLIIIHFLWYLLAYGLEFHDITFAIFVFITFGLFQIIPRWKYFK